MAKAGPPRSVTSQSHRLIPEIDKKSCHSCRALRATVRKESEKSPCGVKVISPFLVRLKQGSFIPYAPSAFEVRSAGIGVPKHTSVNSALGREMEHSDSGFHPCQIWFVEARRRSSFKL